MNDIDYSQLHNLTAQKIVTALIKDGFLRRKGRSSHHIYTHYDGRRVTITYHSRGQTFATKTLRDMLERQAEWDFDDLKRLKLIK